MSFSFKSGVKSRFKLSKSVIKYVFIFCTLLSSQCFATWYQGNAQQAVSTLNFDETRTNTIKRAIANAAIQSNSFIQVEDIVLDGLLQSSKTVLRSEGQIRRVEILSESIDEGVLTVMVKVDIKPLVSCEKDHYAKSLLIAQFSLLKPSQATQGALFDLGIQTSKRFERQLNSQPSVFVSSLLTKAFRLNNNMGNLNQDYLEQVGRYLATEHNSQFILFGAIQDLSLFEQVKEQLILDDVQLRRNYTIQLYLYDAIRAEILLKKNYHGEGTWVYEQNQIVDTANSLFWRTDYGRNMLHTISSAVTDISDVLTCQQSLPQIIDNANGQLVINIGKKQGVKVGDEFEIVNKRLLKGSNSKSYPLFSVDHSKALNVIAVNNQTAVLTSDSLSVINEGQVHNLVSPKAQF
jgi:hypothetical protein